MLSALNSSAIIKRRSTSHKDSSHLVGSGLDSIAWWEQTNTRLQATLAQQQPEQGNIP